MPIELQTDKNGNVITKPVTGWLTKPVADIAVLLVVQYANAQADIETGTFEQLQCILLPQQALELAETLTTQAKRLLEPPSEKSSLM